MLVELKEILEKYGEIMVSFSSYYKYTFTFKGENDEVFIYCNMGGEGDGIYKESVDTELIKLNSVEANYIKVTEKSTGKVVAEYQEVLY